MASGEWRIGARKLPYSLFATPYSLFIRLLEFAQHDVAAPDRILERGGRRLLALERLLHLVLDDVADRHIGAEPQAARIVGRRIERDLLDRDVGARILVVEALLARELVGGARDRQIAGRLMPFRL